MMDLVLGMVAVLILVLYPCDDGSTCIPASYVCDGSSEYGNASWGPDCDDGSDEGADCCESGDCAAEFCVKIVMVKYLVQQKKIDELVFVEDKHN